MLLTADECKNWQSSGKQALLKRVRDAISGDDAKKELAKVALGVAELSVDGSVDAGTLAATLGEAKSDVSPDFAAALAQACWVLSTEIASGEAPEERGQTIEWRRLAAFVAGVVSAALVPGDVALKLIPEDLLATAKLIRSSADFSKRIKQAYTRQRFAQTKFNLAREETEGFAKIISTLSDPSQSPDAAVATVRALIGQFNVDPNRVVDLALEALEHRPDSAVPLRVLRSLPSDRAPHVLGFKLSAFYAQSADRARRGEATAAREAGEAAAAVATSAVRSAASKPGAAASLPPGAGGNWRRVGSVPRSPASLLRAVARVVALGVCPLEAVLPHLSPADDRLAAHATAMEEQLAYAAATMSDLLVEPNKPLSLPQGASALVARALAARDATAWRERHLAAAGAAKPGAAAAAAAAAAATAEPHLDAVVAVAGSQKVDLVAAFIDVGAWSHAVDLIARLQERSIDAVLCGGSVRAALLRALRRVLEPHACVRLGADVAAGGMEEEEEEEGEEEHGAVGATGVDDTARLPEEALCATADPVVGLARAVAVADVLGVWLSDDVGAMAMLCRLADRVLGSVSSTATAQRSAQRAVELVLAAATAAGSPMPVVLSAWQALCRLPYTARYEVYSAVDAAQASGHPVAALAATQVTRLSKGIMKRVTAADTIDPSLCVRLVKLSTSNPCRAAEALIAHSEIYHNLIDIFVGSLAQLPALCRDVVGWQLCRRLAHDRRTVKADGVHPEDWLVGVAKFASAFFTQFPHTELHGVLACVASRLAARSPAEVIVLTELLATMGGSPVVEDVSHDLATSRGGSATLRRVATHGPLRRLPPKSADQLRDALLRRAGGTAGQAGVGSILFALLADQAELVAFAPGGPRHLKLITRGVETCRVAALSLAEFVAGDHTDLAKLSEVVPALSALLDAYCLRPALAFHMCRELLRGALLGADSAAAAVGWQARWHPAGEAVREACEGALEEADAAGLVSPGFYALFWTLKAYDVYMPRAAYDKTVKLMADMRRQAEADAAEVPPPPRDSRRMDPADERAAAARAEAERVRRAADTAKLVAATREAEQALGEDLQAHIDGSRAARALLTKPEFLLPHGDDVSVGDVSVAVAQTCFLPRIMLSREEAHCVARLALSLHAADARGFSLLSVLDALVRHGSRLVLGGTRDECTGLGAFLAEVFGEMAGWELKSSLFAKHCERKWGTRAVGVDSLAKLRALRRKWEGKLLRVVLTALQSGEAQLVHNALSFLTPCVGVFPTTQGDARAMEKQLAIVRENATKNEMKDIELAATRQCGELRRRLPSLLRADRLRAAVLKVHGAADGAGAGAGKKETGKAAGSAGKRTRKEIDEGAAKKRAR